MLKALATFHDSLVYVATSENPAWGITQFSDMTQEDFAAIYLNLQQPEYREPAEPLDPEACPACKMFPENKDFAGSNFDWTTKGAVTGVKNQAQCG